MYNERHIWTSNVTHMNGSCHTYERVMASLHTYELSLIVSLHTCVYAHIWAVAHCVFAHMCLCTHMSCRSLSLIVLWAVAHCRSLYNERQHTYERAMSHIWTGHVIRMNESCPTYDQDNSHCKLDYCVGHQIDERAHTHIISHHPARPDEWFIFTYW